MRAIGAALPRIAAPILGKDGAVTAQLLAEWPAIVGAEIAARCRPMRLTFRRGERRNGTLRLRVVPAAALEIQHGEPLLIERINGFFGYPAVGRLALVQGPAPLPDAPQPPRLRTLAPAEQEALHHRLERVQDPELRAALERLGRAVLGSR
ncbi:MAG: DUF721 domain-containing protein [Alphaproteobacteria bacterium]|nr:DUF721 domain-containing protein [Alphaproteobacteria bacterium]